MSLSYRSGSLFACALAGLFMVSHPRALHAQETAPEPEAAVAEEPAPESEPEAAVAEEPPLGPEPGTPEAKNRSFLEGIDRAEGLTDPAERTQALTTAVAGINGDDPATFGGFKGAGSRAFPREGGPESVLTFRDGNWVMVDSGKQLHNMVLDSTPRRLSFDRTTGTWDEQGYEGNPELRQRDLQQAQSNLHAVADDITNPRWNNAEPSFPEARRQYEAAIPFGRESLRGSVNSDLAFPRTLTRAADGLMEARSDKRALDLYRQALDIQRRTRGDEDLTVQNNQQVVDDLEAQIASDANPRPRSGRQVVDLPSVTRPVLPPRSLINGRIFRP